MTTMTMMMMKGVAVLAALGLFATGAVSADDEFACAPDGKMKQVQLSAFSMEGTLLRFVALRFTLRLTLRYFSVICHLPCSLSRPTAHHSLSTLPLS